MTEYMAVWMVYDTIYHCKKVYDTMRHFVYDTKRGCIFFATRRYSALSRASAARSGSEVTLCILCKDPGSQKWSRNPYCRGLLVKIWGKYRKVLLKYQKVPLKYLGTEVLVPVT